MIATMTSQVACSISLIDGHMWNIFDSGGSIRTIAFLMKKSTLQIPWLLSWWISRVYNHIIFDVQHASKQTLLPIAMHIGNPPEDPTSLEWTRCMQNKLWLNSLLGTNIRICYFPRGYHEFWMTKWGTKCDNHPPDGIWGINDVSRFFSDSRWFNLWPNLIPQFKVTLTTI